MGDVYIDCILCIDFSLMQIFHFVKITAACILKLETGFNAVIVMSGTIVCCSPDLASRLQSRLTNNQLHLVFQISFSSCSERTACNEYRAYLPIYGKIGGKSSTARKKTADRFFMFKLASMI